MAQLTLVSGDGREFSVERSVVVQASTTLRHMLEDPDTDRLELPPLVPARVLAKLVAFLVQNELPAAIRAPTSQAVTPLVELVRATNFLNLVALRALACQALASLMQDKTVEEIREIFNITTRLTPEQEEEVRREIQFWHLS